MQVIIGLVCDRDIPLKTLESAVEQALAYEGLSRNLVIGAATTHRHSDEPAIVELTRKERWPLHFYSDAEMESALAYSPSKIARTYLEDQDIAEAAAVLAAGARCEALPMIREKHLGEDGRGAAVAIVGVDFLIDPPDLDAIFRGARIALVGPSRSIIGSGYGREIESYDLVVRLNHQWPVPHAYIRDVGMNPPGNRGGCLV